MSWKEALGKRELTQDENLAFREFVVAGNYTPQECKELYDAWAEAYKNEMGNKVKQGPTSVASKADELVDKINRSQTRVLDVGAGTGAIGKLLKETGFTNIDALDPSEGMLALAKTQGIYSNYICEFLTSEPLDIPENTYDVVAFSGVLIAGHMHPDAFLELYRLVKPGGYIIFAFADLYLEKENMDKARFHEILETFETEKKWKIISTDTLPRYTEYQGAPKQGKCYVLQVL